MYGINFDEIQCFLTVAKYNNFTEASKILFLSQPTITKQIKRLEKKLDTILFFRNSKKVELTKEGQLLFDRWLPLFEEFRESIEDVHSFRQNSSDTLTLAALEGMGYEDLLSPAIKDFENKYPYVKVQTSFLGFYDLNQRIDDYDVVFSSTYELENRKDLNYLFIKEIELVVSMSSNHPLKEKEILSPKDLANETILSFSEKVSPTGAKHIQEFILKHDITPKMEYFDNISSLRMSVMLNRGVTLSNNEFRFGHENEIVSKKLFPVAGDLF